MENVRLVESPTVLLIDDDQDICLGTSTRLKFGGYRTLIASDGLKGVRLAKEKCPDVILLDVRMPGADGFEVLRQLESFSKTKNIPVIMLSASVIDLQRALDAGVLFYLTKPFESKDLLEAVAAALEKKTDGKQATQNCHKKLESVI